MRKKKEKKKSCAPSLEASWPERTVARVVHVCFEGGGVSSSLFVSLSGVCVRRLSFVAKGKTK